MLSNMLISSLGNRTNLILRSYNRIRNARENHSIPTEDRDQNYHEYTLEFVIHLGILNEDLIILNEQIQSLSEEERGTLRLFPIFKINLRNLSFSDIVSIIKKMPSFQTWLNKVRAINEKILETETVALPEQELALRLAIGSNGTIELDRQTGGADEKRAEALKPGLLRLLEQAESELEKGNQFYGFLADSLAEYREEIDRPASEIEFGLVFTLGSEIKHGLIEARLKDADPELPDLPPRGASKVEAILETHLPFLMASELGRDLVADKEILIETPEEARDGRVAIEALREDVAESEGIFESAAKKAVVAGLKGGDVNATLFSRKVAKNLGIVCAGVTLCAAGPFVGAFSVLAGVGVGTVSGVALLFKGSAFVNAGGELKGDLTPSVKSGLSRIRTFTLQRKDIFIKSVTLADKGEWFSNVLKSAQRNLNTGSEFLWNSTHVIRPIITHRDTILRHKVKESLRDSLEKLEIEWSGLRSGTIEGLAPQLDKNTDILIASSYDFYMAPESTKHNVYKFLDGGRAVFLHILGDLKEEIAINEISSSNIVICSFQENPTRSELAVSLTDALEEIKGL